jgi:endonuclease/exonuclease/phosphatase family metal-dependent hydrolase
VVRRLALDVVAVQEVGGQEELDDLAAAAGPDYAHRAVSAFPDGRGIRVGFLSRLPIEEQEDVVDFPPLPAFALSAADAAGQAVPVTRLGRGALRVRVRVGGTPVELLTAHLKSKLLTFPGARPGTTRFEPRDETERMEVALAAVLRRATEAATLREAANRLLAGNAATPLVLLGDMNDVPDAATSQLLLGPPGSEIGTAGFHREDAGDGVRLFNLAPLMAEGRDFSRVHRGRGELIDHILVSEELLPREPNRRRRLPREVDSVVDFAGAGLASIGDEPRGHAEALAPDHAPVLARFVL